MLDIIFLEKSETNLTVKSEDHCNSMPFNENVAFKVSLGFKKCTAYYQSNTNVFTILQIYIHFKFFSIDSRVNC